MGGAACQIGWLASLGRRCRVLARLMKSEDVGSLPILDGDRLIGIVTYRDIFIQAVAEEMDPRGMPVRAVASLDLVTVGQDEDQSEALNRIASNQVR